MPDIQTLSKQLQIAIENGNVDNAMGVARDLAVRNVSLKIEVAIRETNNKQYVKIKMQFFK